MSWASQNRSYLEGRIRLQGGDPDTMLYSHVLDVSYSIIVELYQSLGMSLFDALEAAAKIGVEGAEAAAPPTPRPEDEAANLMMLSSALSGSDFKGARV